MIEFPFIGPSHPGSDEITLSSMRTVNMYPETDGKYKNPNVLLGFPGHQEFHDFGVGPVRAMKIFNNELIVVTGNEVHKLGAGFSASFIGYINTSTGSVSIAEN